MPFSSMLFLSRLITFLPLLALLGIPQAALAQDSSPWAEGHRSRVRLVAGGSEGGNQLAGVEIQLDPGFKTYWRNPGESGLPPAFDWSKSSNIEAAEVLWPAPARSEDAGGVSYGYHGQVLFPVRVRAQDPAKPIQLALKIDYGVCKDICIPARADLTLTLPNQPSTSTRPLIEAALARVPRPQPLGATAELAILAIEPVVKDGKTVLTVHARVPKDEKGDLFVEAPEGWYLAAGQEKRPASAAGRDGGAIFLVEVLERPKDATGPVNLRLTLACGDGAIETAVSLDAAHLKR